MLCLKVPGVKESLLYHFLQIEKLNKKMFRNQTSKLYRKYSDQVQKATCLRDLFAIEGKKYELSKINNLVNCLKLTKWKMVKPNILPLRKRQTDSQFRGISSLIISDKLGPFLLQSPFLRTILTTIQNGLMSMAPIRSSYHPTGALVSPSRT